MTATSYITYQSSKKKNKKPPNQPTSQPINDTSLRIFTSQPVQIVIHLISPISQSPTSPPRILLPIRRHRSSRRLPCCRRNRSTSPIISCLRSTALLQCQQLFRTERFIVDLCGRF